MLAVGVPDSWPVVVLKDAQEGLFQIPKVIARPLGSTALGLKEYAWPTSAVPGEGVIVSARSAAGVTAVDTLAELFAVFRSVDRAATLELCVIVAGVAVVGMTTIVTVAFVPVARVPRGAVTVPPACVGAAPCDEVAETKVAAVEQMARQAEFPFLCTMEREE